LESAFSRSLAAGAAVLTLVTAPMFLLGPEIVSVLYGRRWAAAGAVLGVLSLVGLTRALSVIISSLLLGLGKPREVAAGKAIEAAVFLSLLYPLTSRFGVAGAAYAGSSRTSWRCSTASCLSGGCCRSPPLTRRSLF
jgi:PST family polysaccharide transporter